MSELKGVLFDVDGTLVDSNDAHAQAWVEAMTEAGHEVAFEEVRRCIGMGGDKLLPSTIGIEKESPEGKRLDKRRGQIFQEKYLPQLKPFPGAKRLLERIHSAGLKVVVATSAKEDEAGPLLEVVDAEDLIDVRTTSGDVDRSKPDPDIMHVALEKAGLTAPEVVMIGDTPYDVESAGKAGIRAIAFRCGGWKDPDLSGAAAIYDGPEDLLAKYDQSPLADHPTPP